MRGKFKKDFQLKKDKLFAVDIAAVGDTVEFEMNKDGTGVINNIEKRKNYISRKAPKIKGASYRGERLEQIIASNIDNLFIISSADLPKFSNKLIDRIIVSGESSNLNIYIVINKIDLMNDIPILEWAKLYRKIGYHVILSSVKTSEGIDEIKRELKGKKNLFWGQSGVGKSSILNLLYPHLNYRIGEISSYNLKGKHTTVTSVMEMVDEDTFIIDTPGIREIDPYGIRKEDLGHYYKEFVPCLENCRFNSCTHNHEPECGVVDAVESGGIALERYESYLSVLETIEEDMVF